VPLIASPTHPDPDTWYPTNDVVFTWVQPLGDPANVDGYRWFLDHTADTEPSQISLGLTNTTTYEGLTDGLWYLHLLARDASGTWSDAAHGAVHVDTRPPQVAIALNPSYPVDNGGWYNAPVTVTVTATDTSTSPGQTGSGVQSIEVSADGAAWQPYTAPLTFAAEMPLTTLWARATDQVDHVSQPMSVTFGLDMTAPDTTELRQCVLPGSDCAAEVITDTVGNQHMHLRGQIGDVLAEGDGVSIRINDQMWTAADAVVDARWAFTSTADDMGAGCFSFTIQSGDRAGNVEALHGFGDTVAWLPRTRPDLSGSRLAVTPAQARPGETVTVTLAVPNSGWQETWVPVVVHLPVGLSAVAETIGSGGVYDPVARTISWAPEYLWPGQERPFTFQAQVDAGAAASDLALVLNAVGTWPIVDSCPADARAGFQALETTVDVTATLAVEPALPSGVDVLAPASPFLTILSGQVTGSRDVELGIQLADPADVQWMYVREWTWDSAGDKWVVAQGSGWFPYLPSYPYYPYYPYRWTLSAGDGVKYLGVWVADAAGNVSALGRSSLAFTNLLQGSQFLADGERVQYRFNLLRSDQAIFGAAALAGDPSLYVWQPRNGFRPDYAAAGAGVVDAVSFTASAGGLYLVEVRAEGDSRYQLLLGGDAGPLEISAASRASDPPEHPLTVSDPLSAGVAGAPILGKTYLPIVAGG
jgi:hypothetical protein